jgi:transcriptional regulator of heat shock response
MHEWHTQLLQGLVEEYIDRAEPVGSATLRHSLSLAVSPATVRHALHQLELAGYIYQPHTSAGRVPTDKGYRFYVDRMQTEQLSQEQERRLLKKLANFRAEYGRLSRAMAKLLAEVSQAIAVSGWLPSRDIEETGLTEVLDQPEGNERDAMREISQLLDNVETYLEKLSALKADQATVFIGEENPLYRAKHTSLITRTVSLPGQQRVVLVILGPKRMAYPANVSLLNSVATFFEEDRL